MLLTEFMLGAVVFVYPESVRLRISCSVCSSSSSDVQTPSVQHSWTYPYLRSMIASTLTDACICKLHLYILSGCMRQTANKKRQTLHRYENRLSLSTKTFEANLLVWHGPLSKVYFQKCTFESWYFQKKLSSVSLPLCSGYMWNKIISKFQRLIAAHEYFPTCSMSLK